MLTDLVIANHDEVQNVAAADGLHIELFGGMQARNVDQIKIAVWYSLINQTAYDPDFFGKPIYPDDYEESEGPWILEVPGEFVAAAASLTPDQIAELASQSIKDEEFDGWDEDTVAKTLQELAGVCNQAIARKKNVLLLLCI